MDLRSNLSKARGLGPAHSGTHHWWMQRVTAIALVPLVFWFVSSVIKSTSYHGIEGVIYLLSSPINAICMVLFIGTSIYHGTLGIKVIIEDYIHCPCSNKIMDIITKFIMVVSVVSATFSILFIHIKTYEHPNKFDANLWSTTSNCHKNVGQNTAKKQNIEENKTPITVIETPQE